LISSAIGIFFSTAATYGLIGLWIHEPLPGEQEAVVGRVVPREHFGIHRVLVELLVPLDDLRRLVAVDRRCLAVRLEHLAARGPEHGPERDVGVGALADGNPDRVALLLEDLPRLQQVVPRLRRLHAGFLELRFVIASHERDPEPRHGSPAGRGETRLLGERIPAAVLRPQVVDEIADVYQLLLVEKGVRGAGDDDVVSRLGRNLRRAFGEHLRTGDRVDPHGHAGLLAEDVGLAPKLVVRSGNEMVEAEHRQLTLLGERRGAIERDRRPGGHDRRALEEAAARDQGAHG
jgi:hypothetical protein